MQSCISSSFLNLFKVLFGRKQFRILMVGLDAVGQTTILYRLKTGKTIKPIPTIGFNMETIEHNSHSLTISDVGGGDKIRPLWKHYFCNSEALIFVVDSSDRERIEEAGHDLARLLNDDAREDAIVLVFANKQDIKNAMNCTEITDKLRLPRLNKVKWHIQASCAITGDGLREGLDWLTLQLNNSKGV